MLMLTFQCPECAPERSVFRERTHKIVDRDTQPLCHRGIFLRERQQSKNAPRHYVGILVNCPHLHAASYHHPHAPRKSSADSGQVNLSTGAAARPTFTRRRAGSGHPTASTSLARPPWTAQIGSEASPSRGIDDASRMGGAKRGGFRDARRNQRARDWRR